MLPSAEKIISFSLRVENNAFFLRIFNSLLNRVYPSSVTPLLVMAKI